MLAFYLDEQVSQKLVPLLIALGYDTTSAIILGNRGLHDGRQLLIAANLRRTLISYNVGDFKLLHRSWLDWSSAWQATAVARHAGIMLIYSSKGIDAVDLAQAIHRFAQANSDLTNRLVAWSPTADWHDVI